VVLRVNGATPHLAQATSAVDLGTGSGERLLQLKDVFPPRMVATERYAHTSDDGTRITGDHPRALGLLTIWPFYTWPT
jgi:hypothetical protein